MLEKIMFAIQDQYGLVVLGLVVIIAVLLGAVKLLWTRNEYLGNKLVETIENNTRVITQLVERLDYHNNDYR